MRKDKKTTLYSISYIITYTDSVMFLSSSAASSEDDDDGPLIFHKYSNLLCISQHNTTQHSPKTVKRMKATTPFKRERKKLSRRLLFSALGTPKVLLLVTRQTRRSTLRSCLLLPVTQSSTNTSPAAVEKQTQIQEPNYMPSSLTVTKSLAVPSRAPKPS